MIKGIITNFSIGRYGRFGNQLFQIAAVIGIARKQGFEWALPIWINHDHKDRFGSNEECDIHSQLLNPWACAVWDESYRETTYPFGYHEVQLPSGNHDLRGHFQSEKYFKHAMDEVRFRLTFKDEPEYMNAVAIHVRRGDYDDRYHPILGLDYYERAMAHFPLGTTFYVFSDDKQAAVEMLLPLSDKYEVLSIQKSDYIEDFKWMKRCHSFICANSSYSFMAALLSNQPGKKIVMPKNWFGPAWADHGCDPVLMARDIYPENAIVV